MAAPPAGACGGLHGGGSFGADEMSRQSLGERLRALHEVTGAGDDEALAAQLARERVTDPLDRAGVSA